ncbi:MAG: DUF4838 domain-containing protein [Treponema sp.]|jgi:hypothetical protein|nr:DUF4838 domain-containing protein [Treponema sp.]
MADFDVSKGWVILLPQDPGVKKAAEDAARCIGLLRKQAGLSSPPPALADASGPAPPPSVPVIVLNSEQGPAEQNGFSWRAGPERVEIYGESSRGLCNGIYSFLAALGIRWPEPGKELLPPCADKPAVYPLASPGASEPSRFYGTGPEKAPWKRYVIDRKNPFLKSAGKREALIAWAARNRCDALVFPLKTAGKYSKSAGEYALAAEAGGWELSLLLPRRLFLFHSECFRMEDGRRRKEINFCPTNPATLRILKKEAKKYFRNGRNLRIFHLWPDRGNEKTWCSCPACRAFSPAEQNRIAVSAAADALLESGFTGFISYYEAPGEGGDIPLRPNLFRMERMPET